MIEKKISPEKYAQFIEGLTLDDIKINFVNAKVDPAFMPPANLSLKDESSYQIHSDGKLQIVQKYIIEARKPESSDANLAIEVQYVLLYKTLIPMTDEIFDIFKQGSLRLQTWPFLRQFVHQMTYYMHLPPLILDVIKVEPQKVENSKKENG